MKIKKILLLATLLLSYEAFAENITGRWTTIDDKTGQKRAIVELKEMNGILSGQIIKVFAKKGDTGRCNNCPGAFKDQPTQGLRFVWGLKKINQDTWDKGHILDPKSGHVYSAKITQHGKQLDVRGYLGLAAIGRSQTWIR
jgi:uncharacterized protein (DUF2147 family)